MRILQRLYLPALCLTLLSGCATQPLPSVNQFLKLESDPRVRYEPGADAYARQVAGLLPQAIRQVESAHARPFSSSVEVFVCASVDCKRCASRPNSCGPKNTRLSRTVAALRFGVRT